LTTLDFVDRPSRRIVFTHPFRARHGSVRRGRRRRTTRIVTTTRRPETCPHGGNRHGGNGANQQCETNLAHHAFSLVYTPIRFSPYGPPVGVGSTASDFTHH
jgi:hypothetical protein